MYQTKRKFATTVFTFAFYLCLMLFSSQTFANKTAPIDAGFKQSENGIFKLKIETKGQSAISLNQFQQWVITIKDAQLKPVYPARIGINGGMPAHGHGLPTQPRVTRYLGDGQYLVEGMKFNMDGQWLLQFQIVTESQQDVVKVDIDVNY